MPKMTVKYREALFAAGREGIKVKAGIDQDKLYGMLQEKGLMWDSSQQEWMILENEPADAPTGLVMVRVWADLEVVQEAADAVEADLVRRKFRRLERSDVFRCRPPKQLEGRVYLKFLPPGMRGIDGH